MAKTQFLSFEKYVPKHLISLLYNFYFIFRRRDLIFKKTDPENVPSQIHETFNMSQMNPKQIFYNTVYLVQPLCITGYSLLRFNRISEKKVPNFKPNQIKFIFFYLSNLIS